MEVISGAAYPNCVAKRIVRTTKVSGRSYRLGYRNWDDKRVTSQGRAVQVQVAGRRMVNQVRNAGTDAGGRASCPGGIGVISFNLHTSRWETESQSFRSKVKGPARTMRYVGSGWRTSVLVLVMVSDHDCRRYVMLRLGWWPIRFGP